MSTLKWRGVSRWLLWWLASFVVWLLLISQVDWLEIVIGGLAASLAATGACLVALRDDAEFAFRWEHAVALARRLPRALSVDTVRVLAALTRVVLGTHIRGRMVETPFAYGEEDDPQEAARRALVVGAVSATPNSIVVELEHDRMEVHRLLPGPMPSDRVWPI